MSDDWNPDETLLRIAAAAGMTVGEYRAYLKGLADGYNREPPEPDGEAFRGGEAAAYEAENQARIQRELK